MEATINLSALAATTLLIGGAGDDALIGGAGKDTMRGGQGSDFYYVNNVGDKVIENASEGELDNPALTTLASFTFWAKMSSSSSFEVATDRASLETATTLANDDLRRRRQRHARRKGRRRLHRSARVATIR